MRVGAREAAVVAAGVCTFLNLYAPQAVLPQMAASLGAPPGQTALAITAPLLAIAVMAPIAGLVSDRLGRKWLIVAACLALALPTLLVATAASLPALLAFRFAQGILLPFIFVVTVAYVGDEAAGADGVRLAGIYSLGSILGGFGGRFVTGLAADLASGPEGWRAGFVVLAVLAVLAAATVAALLPPERRFVRLSGGAAAVLATWRGHLGNARLLSICAIGWGMLFANVAVFTYINFQLALPPYGLSPVQLGFVFTVYLLGLATTAMAARLTLRLGRRHTLGLAIALAAAGLLATLLPATAAVIAGLACLAGGLFVVQALCVGYLGVVVTQAKSSAVGIYVTIYYTGGALGGLAAGPAWQLAGWPGVAALVGLVLLAMWGVALAHWPRGVA